MGFCIKQQSVAASLKTHGPDSPATPKTHTRHFSCRLKNAYRGLQVEDLGYRFYSANLARWMNRDPIEEQGGLNLFEATGNNPIGLVDALGLDWTLRRSKTEKYAYAVAGDASDSFDALGRILLLDDSDHTEWAHTKDINPVTCKEYKIPNTIYFHMGTRGWIDYFPTSLISIRRGLARNDRDDYESKGNYTVWVEDVTDAMAMGSLRSDNILGYIFVGHGGGGGTINTFDTGGGGVIARRYTRYGISFLSLFACGSADRNRFSGRPNYWVYNDWEWNVSKRGWFTGYEGDAATRNEIFVWRITRGVNRTSAR